MLVNDIIVDEEHEEQYYSTYILKSVQGLLDACPRRPSLPHRPHWYIVVIDIVEMVLWSLIMDNIRRYPK